MIRIDIKPLKPGIHEFEWSPNAEALELDPLVFRELKVEVRLDFHPTRVFATLHTYATARLECDRTLVAFDEQVEGKYSVLFAGASLLEHAEEQKDDIRELAQGDEEIDLTDVVRDTFILSIPARKVAPGAEFEEIPLAFGAPSTGEPFVDPRWEALRNLSSLNEDDGSGE